MAFRSCIAALSALTTYGIAAEAEGFAELVADMERRHTFLREVIGEPSVWQRKLRGLRGPIESALDLGKNWTVSASYTRTKTVPLTIRTG